jgi:CBS domain-containing protein
MSDKPQDTRPQETKPQDASGMTDGAVRSPAQGGAGRRAAPAGGDTARKTMAVGGETARHLREAAGAPIRHASEGDANGGVTESAARHLKDEVARLAAIMQASARDLGALFALRGLNGDHLRDLRESVGAVVDSTMRTNARMMRELFDMTSPAVAIDLQRRYATEYMDTMLHGTVTLFRALHRSADHAVRPLEEHVAQRRQRRAAHSNGWANGRTNSRDDGPERVADVMRAEPPVVSPEDTVQRAVQLMREADLGGLPVRDGDQLMGMVTDRDIALRVVTEARDPRQTRVRDVMTPDVPFVFEDDKVEHVAEDMAGRRLRRLPVLNHEKRLVGVISLADLVRRDHNVLADNASDRGGHAQAAE